MYDHPINDLKERLDATGYRNKFRIAVDKKELEKVRKILKKLNYTEVAQQQVLQVYKDYFAGKLNS